MHINYFTERPVRWLEEEDVLTHRAFFGLPNSKYDHVRASEDYNYYLDEYMEAERLGFDGVALNEHHGNPFCMGNVMHLEASILARITERVKIFLIGTPLPVTKNPLRTAEELATIDVISRGRLVTGWVRGGGSEQFFNNANPAYNREMFEEAHDFIQQAWTRPGPWRYEGKHFHYRHVNPWALPYQKPSPLSVVPGVLSPETVRWAADKAYPYIALGTSLGPTADLWDTYADLAAEAGYQAGSENYGYVIPTFVADTEEKAQEGGYGFVFGGGQGAFAKPEHTLPPGYNSKAANQRLAATPGGSWQGINRDKLMAASQRTPTAAPLDVDVVRGKLRASLQRSQDNLQHLIGTPDQVAEKMKTIIRVLRPGIFTVFHVQGAVSDEARRRSMQLLGEQVLPEVRAYADELGIASPFDRAPGSVRLRTGEQRSAVVDRGGLPVAA
jgi:alkanesulfonate monooxygenase SsuD/methylene tetrahydromethanopterin reductase-like flavin-dependent oxidoreductase (luciferase family)